MKISVDHHMHLTASIREILAITREYLDRQPIKDARDHKRRKIFMCIKENSIAEMFHLVDDKGAAHMSKEYSLILSQYTYKHHGSGYSVHNSVTNSVNLIEVKDDGIAYCECSSFVMYTLPCRHLLFVMKSVVDLKPNVAKRWLKHNLVAIDVATYSHSITSQCESIEPNIWSQFGTNSLDCVPIQNEQQKYNALKPVFDELSKLLCVSGQKEFNHN